MNKTLYGKDKRKNKNIYNYNMKYIFKISGIINTNDGRGKLTSTGHIIYEMNRGEQFNFLGDVIREEGIENQTHTGHTESNNVSSFSGISIHYRSFNY